jgi:ABC-type hemin transport system substrate-binding protein
VSPTCDDLALPVDLPRCVERVVSLVPSLTEAVALTAPGLLVGATDWCTHPAGLSVTRVGGTKSPDVAAVVGLRPDLVVANEEENRAADLDALRGAGVVVWVTAPRTLPAALDSLHRMLTVACRLPRPPWLDEAAAAWPAQWSRSEREPPAPRRRAVVPIWRRPWMALGRDTFAGDVLARLGIVNVLAGHPERYPRVVLADLPPHDLVVLPDEPYPFSPADGPEAFPGVPAACVSGRHLTWYGPSLAVARDVLADQLRTG